MSGGVTVPLCISHPSSTLSYYLQDSEASLVLVTKDLLPRVSDLGVKTFILEDESVGNGLHQEDDDQVTPVEASSPAMILYTSGTTGPPKGVVLTHGNIHHQISCLTQAWEWSSDDTILHVLPLHHTHGIVNCLLCPLSVGATVHMIQFCPATVWDILTRGQVNVFMAVPTIYSKLIQFLENNKDRVIRSDKCEAQVRLMVSGSAALAVPTLNTWRDLTGHVLLERYGMTEIGMALSQPLHGQRVPGYVGRPLPGVSVKIVRLVIKAEQQFFKY